MNFEEFIDNEYDLNALYDNLNHIRSFDENDRLRTLELYEIRRLVIPSLGMKELEYIKAENFLTIYNCMRRSGYSEESVRRLHTMLLEVVDRMVADSIISENPLRYLHIRKLHTMPKVYLTPLELKVVMTGMQGFRHFNVYRMELYSGLTPQELLALSQEDIDWVTGRVNIRKALSFNTYRYKVERGVSERMIRSFYLSRKALLLLGEEMENRKKKQECAGASWNNEDNLIFCNAKGGVISPISIRNGSKRHIGTKDAFYLYKQFEIGSYEDLRED